MRSRTTELFGEIETAPRRRAKRLSLGLLPIAMGLSLVLAGARYAAAQVVEAANAGRAFVWVGGSVSGYTSPYGKFNLLGATAFVDADTIRRFGVEGEARWLDYHQSLGRHAETYLVGVRYHFNVGRFQPYVKGLGGVGQFTYTYGFAHDSVFVIAPGGGVDYRLGRRIHIRAIDFEYQYWPAAHFGGMSSAGISSGIRFRVF